jgi:hypothetical protein
MSNTGSLYWLTRLDGINSFFNVLLFIGLVCFVIWVIAFFVQIDDMNDRLWKKFRGALLKIVIPTGIVLLVDVLTPDRDEAIFIMAGGKTLDFAAQDSSLQKIPAQTTLIISRFLEGQIEEMTNEQKADSTSK